MTGRERRRVVLSDYKAKKIDEDAIDVELPDGSVVVLPPPQIWPDAVIAASRDGDLERAGQELLGKDEYGRFVAAGGSGALLNGIIVEELGLPAGGSLASSSS